MLRFVKISMIIMLLVPSTEAFAQQGDGNPDGGALFGSIVGGLIGGAIGGALSHRKPRGDVVPAAGAPHPPGGKAGGHPGGGHPGGGHPGAPMRKKP